MVNKMTVEELKAYAKEVGVPERVFKEVFAPALADENRVLDDLESVMAKAECNRQAEYCKWLKGVLDRHRAEREQRKKDKGE